jgi:hypothetical protein
MMKGVFGLENHADLFKKLEWEYKLLTADPTNSYLAYNFFVTAWHMLEWKYSDKKDTGIRNNIREETPLLQICEHLAVGAKHFEPRSARHNSVIETKKSGVWADGSWAPGSWKDGTWATWLVVTLSGDAKNIYGDQIKVEDLATDVMEFWKINI